MSQDNKMANLAKVTYFTRGLKTPGDAFTKSTESLIAIFKSLKNVAFKLNNEAVVGLKIL